MPTKRMSVKRFCDECLEVFDEVHETGCKYLITRNGRGVIKVVPLEPLDSLQDKSPNRKKKKR
ncbi:MAG: type II toxin-antitoxin system prevent-host-death family antitoxin [Candidatus Korobacteraceae bacterium]|jgi:prevent-host-death family protein